MPDFNLAGLFRHACTQLGSAVLLIIPEVDKDEFIYAMERTRLVQQHSPMRPPRMAVPSEVRCEGVVVFIIASHALESGHMILESLDASV